MQERSVIDVNTETETRKVSKRSTKLAMHCSETLNNKVYIIGGYYTRKYIHYIGKLLMSTHKVLIKENFAHISNSLTCYFSIHGNFFT